MRLKRGLRVAAWLLTVFLLLYGVGVIIGLRKTRTITTPRGDIFSYISESHDALPFIPMAEPTHFIAIYNGKRLFQRPLFTWEYDGGPHSTPSFPLLYEDSRVRVYWIRLDYEDSPGYIWKHLPSGRAGYFECYDAATLARVRQTDFLRPFADQMQHELLSSP